MILECVARSPAGRAKLGEIAEAAQLHKSTAFSLLESLATLGYISQVPQTREYVLGQRLFELARSSESQLNVAQLARPLMLRFLHAANESVVLALPSTYDILIASTVESSHSVRGARYRGGHSPYHASAAGKAMLAFMPEADRDAILDDPDLPRLTAKTTQSRATLLRQLKETQERGYALSLEEEEVGANAVAAPILSPMEEVLGAIAIWGPAPRLSPDRLKSLGAELARECRVLLRRS